ncbi:MAG: hypothetical protein P9X24_08045 [Candidatus Hatepunaea meridiana]|nr:hypothetical protein [Candidatus Hatepunaea meridiana]
MLEHFYKKFKTTQMEDLPKNELTCQAAKELIDNLQPLTDVEQGELKVHLVDCPDCSAAMQMEDALRKVIAPVQLPSPSVGFEASLMAELDITPVAEPKISLFAKTSWAAGILSLSVLLFYLMDSISKIALRGGLSIGNKLIKGFFSLDGLANQVIGSVTGSIDGFWAYLFGELSQPNGMNGIMILNLMIVSVVIISGIIAVSMSNRDLV